MKRLTFLEEENARLKKPLAEAMLAKEAFQTALDRKFCGRPEAGSRGKHLRGNGSFATSCLRAAGLSLYTSRYETQRPNADAHLSGRITELALKRRRFGYRRVWKLLRREGIHVS